MRKSKYKNYFKLEQKIGKWEITNTDIIPHEKTKEAQIKCRCECGFEKLVYCLTLIKGQSTACFNCGHGNKGENNLGKLLMKIRSEIRGEQNKRPSLEDVLFTKDSSK